VAGEELVTIAAVMLTDKLSRGTAQKAISEGKLRVRRLGPRTVRIKKGDPGARIAAVGPAAAWCGVRRLRRPVRRHPHRPGDVLTGLPAAGLSAAQAGAAGGGQADNGQEDRR